MKRDMCLKKQILSSQKTPWIWVELINIRLGILQYLLHLSPQGYTCLLVGSLERSATLMASSWKQYQNSVPEKAGVCLLPLQFKLHLIYTGRGYGKGESAHPMAPGYAHNFGLFITPAAWRGWDRTVLQMRQMNLKGNSPTCHIWNSS